MTKKTHSNSEINPPIDRRTEKDIDELVHTKKEEKPIEKGEEDADDIVHHQYKTKPAADEMADPDDLVHEETDDDE